MPPFGVFDMLIQIRNQRRVSWHFIIFTFGITIASYYGFKSSVALKSLDGLNENTETTGQPIIRFRKLRNIFLRSPNRQDSRDGVKRVKRIPTTTDELQAKHKHGPIKLRHPFRYYFDGAIIKRQIRTPAPSQVARPSGAPADNPDITLTPSSVPSTTLSESQIPSSTLSDHPSLSLRPTFSIQPTQSQTASSSPSLVVDEFPSTRPANSRLPSTSSFPSMSTRPSTIATPSSILQSQIPSVSTIPSDEPSLALDPDSTTLPSAPPSLGDAPTTTFSIQPSLSQQPSITIEPSGAPSQSQQPSFSKIPSASFYPSEILLPTQSHSPSQQPTATIQPSIVPSQSIEPSFSNHPSISVIPSRPLLPTQSENPSSLAFGTCSICGDGKQVGNLDAIFIFPGLPSVRCGELENAGLSGSIAPDACSLFPGLVGICECAPAPSPSLSLHPSVSVMPTGVPSGDAATQREGETCDWFTSGKCENSACAHQFSDRESPYICCPSGALEVIMVSDGSNDAFCTGQLEGAECRSDTMCISGACVSGVCL